MHESVKETLRRLREIAPEAPLLALGQTVFWDEPLKAMLPLLGDLVDEPVKLVAGVHDTDYFAKLPGSVPSNGPFVALPKNDGSTKDFWSAAGEFSALFGSETPVTKEALARAGVEIDRITRGDQAALDEATEAWGWRGVASTDPVARVTSETPIHRAFDELQSTFRWALKQTRDSLERPSAAVDEVEDRLQTILCDARDGCPGQTLAEFYECMLPRLHELVTGSPSVAEFTRTGKLLKFDTTTALLPRFALVDLFLRPETAALAAKAYDDSVRGTEVYTLDRFGTGAVPFDLVIRGEGRGTLRLTSKMLVVMTPEPKFVKLEKPVESIGELAAVTEAAFGSCVLVGKAISFIAMLASEFVFAFHEGASMYVSQTREMVRALRQGGAEVPANPILRVSFDAWDAIGSSQTWLRLPEPLRAPFGADVVSATTLACTWRCVRDQQAKNLELLGEARGITALLDALYQIRGGRWERLRSEFEDLRSTLAPLDETAREIDEEVRRSHDRLRAIKAEWSEAERKRGEAFRQADHHEREELGALVSDLRAEKREVLDKLALLRKKKAEAASTRDVRNARERRNEIQREAELARLRTVREAVTATAGIEKTNRRPAAWWLPMVSPDGTWFEGLLETAKLRLEPFD